MAVDVTSWLCLARQEHKRLFQAERNRFDDLQTRYEEMMLEHMQDSEKKENRHEEMLRVSPEAGWP